MTESGWGGVDGGQRRAVFECRIFDGGNRGRQDDGCDVRVVAEGTVANLGDDEFGVLVFDGGGDGNAALHHCRSGYGEDAHIVGLGYKHLVAVGDSVGFALEGEAGFVAGA